MTSIQDIVDAFVTRVNDQDLNIAEDINALQIGVSLLASSTYSWIDVSDTWTYASATTITVPSGAASLYSVGTKLKMTNSGTKYNYVVAVADTLLTVRGDGVANAAITVPQYSNIASPVGFPHYFAYTPTGIAASNVTLSGRFSMTGRTCKVDFLAVFTGGITFTTMPTLPVPVGASYKTIGESYDNAGQGSYVDASVGIVVGTIFPGLSGSATTVYIHTDSGAAISTIVPITWANGDNLSLHFEYEI